MEEESVSRPKWLLELENRKRKPRLAHEAGAGASCMNCKSACPGLDLHFWRKICKICKCSRDDHDVHDDEFPQFDLLFGPSGKFKKKSLHMRINNKEQTEEETTFDWIPPNTTKELAIDYMKALPAEKLPIKGSSGAALRRHLLQKQLPLHDIDYKVCNKLTEQEQKQFEKYLESIKKYVGQGKVIKMFDIRPFDCSLMTPTNATDMQHRNLQHKPHTPSSGVHLRTPSSFAIKTSYANIKQPYKSQNKQDATGTYDNKLHNEQEYNCLYAQNNMPVSNIARSQPLEGKFYENSQCANNVNKKSINSKVVNTLTPAHLAEQEIVSAHTMQTSGKCISYVETSPKSGLKNTLQECGEILKDTTTPCIAHSKVSEAASIADSMLAEAFLPPSAIHANDIIGSTLDKKELMFIREKLTDKYNATDNPITHVIPQLSRPLDAKCNDIVRHPHNAGAKEDNNFGNNKEAPKKAIIESNTNSLLNKYNFSDSSIDPVSNSQYSVDPFRTELNSSVLQPTVIHSEQLQNQVFAHVIGSNEQPTISQNIQHTEYLKDGIENLKINATKMQKCENCHEDIRIGDIAVIAEKANNASWHPGCFVCSVCNELLVDLVYFYYKNKLYCGRDLAAFLGIPRCFACDELIFVREYTVAEGHNYHVKHFCCWDCDMPLAGQQYITENDRPLCLLCYRQSYAKVCAACNISIAADQQGVAIKNLNFHATEVCFCCYSCKKNLLNGRMAIKEDKLFCSKECIAKFAH